MKEIDSKRKRERERVGGKLTQWLVQGTKVPYESPSYSRGKTCYTQVELALAAALAATLIVAQLLAKNKSKSQQNSYHN